MLLVESSSSAAEARRQLDEDAVGLRDQQKAKWSDKKKPNKGVDSDFYSGDFLWQGKQRGAWLGLALVGLVETPTVQSRGNPYDFRPIHVSKLFGLIRQTKLG